MLKSCKWIPLKETWNPVLIIAISGKTEKRYIYINA